MDDVRYVGPRPANLAVGPGRQSWFRRMVAPLVAIGRLGKRAITSLPWSAGGPRSTDVSMDRALSLIPLFACVRILADSVAQLPVDAFRKLGERRQELSRPPQLLVSPAARGTRYQWMHQAVVSLALRGNAYGLITSRDGMGFATGIEWLHPDEVYVDESRPTLPVYYWLGHPIPLEDVVHIPWFVLPGRVVGLSPIAAFARSIGVGLSATNYGLSWFEADGTPPAVMRNTQKQISPKDADAIKERLMAALRTRKPLVHGSDWEFTALQVSPDESQFIETMKLNATQIASIFGVPAEQVGGEFGGSLTYANVEQQAINFVTFTLSPWLVRLESVLTELLPERQFVKFNVDALIRPDLLSRYRAHHLTLLSGWRTLDEIRQLEDLPPLPNGYGELPGVFNPKMHGLLGSGEDEQGNDETGSVVGLDERHRPFALRGVS